MKRNDIIILIVAWELLGWLFSLVVIAAIAIFAIPPAIDLSGGARAGALFGASAGMLLFLSYFTLSTAAVIGLLLGREWGRISAVVHAALNLVIIPFGTAIGFLTLIYLTRPRVRERFQGGWK